MEFAGQIRFPDLDHPGVPVTFLLDDNQAELVLEGETLGRWSLFDVHARRLVASAFEVDLDGHEVTFVAEKPMDFAYRGVEHMAQAWARYKAMNLARRILAVRWSRRGTVASRIDELEEAMVENLERERSEPDRLAGEQPGGLDVAQPAPVAPPTEETPVAPLESVSTQSAETERLEAEKLEAHRVEAEKLEADRIALEEERARLEEDRSRLIAEREAAEREVAQSITSARDEIARLETERAQLAQIETEHAERERLGEEQAEKRRLEAEALEAKREELAVLEAQRAEAERLETERLQELDAERSQAERVEAERVEAERVEAERVEAERVEADRVEADRVEAERVEADRVEAERVEAERVEAERVEADRAAASQEAPEMVKERLGTSAEASDDDQIRDLVVDLGEFEVPPSQDQPQPVLSGADQKSGLMGAVRAAFTRSGGKNHVHDFVDSPAGPGMTRSICSECGFVSISTSD